MSASSAAPRSPACCSPAARDPHGRRRQGLQQLDDVPLALHVLRRLAPQVDEVLISANRHLDRYATLGAPFGARVVPDDTADFPGPLAGLLAGMRAASAPLVGVAPCDSRICPPISSRRCSGARCAACGHRDGGQRRRPRCRSPQPTFALLRTSLAVDLAARLAAGDRQGACVVRAPQDDRSRVS
ncbi:NTP transferase domain-containing protein [Burkholderia multivorans]|uniref:NTP transferase domain-containing protein n=1 Tax=Burkholderia multivorans TaxID=87883 RepID=UPI00338F2EFF